VFVFACGSKSPPATPPPAPVAAVDAGVEPASPDALPDAVVNAAPYVFRYATAERTETWTLRHADGTALLVVDNAQGPRRYSGPAIDSAGTLDIDVATSGAKLALKCKRDKLAVSAKCNDRKAKPIEVLSCYHADFTTPMPFAPPPGIEYVVDGTCNGYRLVAP
jgi:hypothetical protein